MVATYKGETFNINGKQLFVRSLEADLDEVTIRWIGRNDLENVNYYGVNGPYFEMSASSPSYENLYGYAIQNGTAVGGSGKGDWNSGGNGFMVYLKNNLPDGTFLFVTNNASQPSSDNKNIFPVYKPGYSSPIQTSSVKWAIGGTSLHLDQSLTETQYYNKLNGDGEWMPSGQSNRPRTAIGYKGGKKIVLATIFSDTDRYNFASAGCTIWDVRTLMKDKFNCSMGLNLDGGGSTQMRFKANGVNIYHGNNRNVYAMVSVPM